MKMVIVKQDALESINIINKLKLDNMFVVLEEYNGYSTICQYTKKYDNFHIISVKTENLDRSNELKSADEKTDQQPW